MELQTVGVVGCGLMGSGIVEVCVRSGLSVVVREVSQPALHGGLGRLRTSLDKGLERGKLTADEHAAALDRVRGTTELADLADCDWVIEAAVEDLAIKQATFRELDGFVGPDTVLSSNTSSISITKIAAATSRADRVIGTHFFNPVPVMPLLELVRGLQTSDATYQAACALGERLGKTLVLCQKDAPGFIVNRLFIPYGLDAIRALDDGVASIQDFDTAMKLGMSHPMGPFTLMDFVGLDTMLFIADAMYDETKDPRYAAPPRLRQMVAAGWLGRKSGRGFYGYGKAP